MDCRTLERVVVWMMLESCMSLMEQSRREDLMLVRYIAVEESWMVLARVLDPWQREQMLACCVFLREVSSKVLVPQIVDGCVARVLDLRQQGSVGRQQELLLDSLQHFLGALIQELVLQLCLVRETQLLVLLLRLVQEPQLLVLQ